MSQRRPTRKDVALRAGVAPSTVSIILQDKGDALRIPMCTQSRVREAARALGYYPNWHIGSLLKGRSGAIGLYLRWDQWARPDGYWPTLFWHIECAIAEAGLRLLIHNAREGTPTEESFARHAGGAVDGVMILNSGHDPIVPRILEAGLPAVEVGDVYSELPFVGLDGPMGIRLALEHLADRGYRHPAYVGHITNYPQNMEVRSAEFLTYAHSRFRIDAAPRAFAAGAGDEFFASLMSLNPRPDCVLCASDEFAFEILKHCARAGISVPDDLAIVGFDAIPAFGATRTMTSVSTPLREMADLALQKLAAVIEGESYDHDTLLPVSLRIGDTT